MYQLLDTVVENVPFRDSTAFTQALDTLRARPVDELELRLRETLGLASHRLDAWITGLARERLDNLRADDAHPNGIQLGGFGWVEDLRPHDKGSGDSQGFIHAPSLAHATTAAVLRAGWNAHGTSASDSTMAVDLRSDRIRLASWLLDGVRQGQGLGDLLGRRFERRLHDAHLDGFIDDCRRAVLESQGKKRDPTGPVDGLLLAELYAGAGVKAGATLLKPASVPSTVALRGVQAALNDIRASMDAVADAALGDSVHHLLQGNQARAAATLDAISTGEVSPPELRSVRTPSPGVGIVHRLLLTLGAAAKGKSAWGSGPRARLEPALESWCARMLGDPERVRCRVEFAGGSPAPLAVTLADLMKSGGLSALDVVFEAPVGALAGDTAWIRRIEAHVLAQAQYAAYEGALVIAAADAPMDGTISLHDLAELAQALRSLIAKSRPLDGRDLALPGADAEAEWNVPNAEKRVDELVAGFTKAISALEMVLPSPTELEPHPVGQAALTRVRQAMLPLAGFAQPGAIPRTGFSETGRAALYAEAWALADRARRRLDELTALKKAGTRPMRPAPPPARRSGWSGPASVWR